MPCYSRVVFTKQIYPIKIILDILLHRLKPKMQFSNSEPVFTLTSRKTLDCTKVTVQGFKQIFKLNQGRKISTRELKQPQFQEHSGSYVQLLCLQIITTRYKYKICQIQQTLCFDEDILRLVRATPLNLVRATCVLHRAAREVH